MSRHVARAPRAWQRMLSGRRLDILDPSPLDIELDDIAHGLARVARWNGQTSGSFVFSVAQHSCLVEAVATQLDPDLTSSERLAVLLHDAPEYVMGDTITPLKAALGERYGAIERRLAQVVHLAFGLPVDLPMAVSRLIKRADRVAAWLEATGLAGFSRSEAIQAFGRPECEPDSLACFLTPWSAEVAEARFRERVSGCAGTTQSRHRPVV